MFERPAGVLSPGLCKIPFQRAEEIENKPHSSTGVERSAATPLTEGRCRLARFGDDEQP